MIEFNEKEAEFLESLEEARIATSHNDIPHVKPVSFVLYENTILVATDYGTRTYANIKANPNTSIAIDAYKSGAHKAVCIQGKTELVENGETFKKYGIFHEKFEWVRETLGKKMKPHF